MNLKWSCLAFLFLILACQRPVEPVISGNFLNLQNPLELSTASATFENIYKDIIAQEKKPTSLPQAPEEWSQWQNPFQLRFWQNGKTLALQNSQGGNLQEQFQKKLKKVLSEIGNSKDFNPLGNRRQIQWTLAFDFKPWNRGNFIQRQKNLKESWGLWGLVILDEKKTRWFYPTDFLLEGKKYRQLFEEVCGTGKRPNECVSTWEEKAYTFQIFDYLSTNTPPYFEKLIRLSPTVPIDQVNPGKITTRLELMRTWYLKNMSPEGKMTYLYRPATDKVSKQHNNMIRQWMTTLAMFRLGKFLGDDILLQAAEKNLSFNIKTYLKRDPEKGLAYIYFRKKAKLGSAAFALMSLLESQTNPEKTKLIEELTKLILTLHDPNGAFKTFYLPPNRNDNQNFYPGEALLALMTLYESNPQQYQSLLPVVESSFQYYRKFFRKNPNPAFVPWHTMALYRLFLVNKNKEVSDFVFEMNDFLLEIQNTPKSLKNAEADTLGRFYDPKKRKYGPPHASSTAVYSEGLSDAFRLALQLGDTKRMQNYAYGVQWGLRSLLQLQYVTDNSFYIKNSSAVLGALATTVYNGNIRVDNTQHATMAFLNFLATNNGGKTLLEEAKKP